MVIVTNLTSICCVYKKKIVKIHSYPLVHINSESCNIQLGSEKINLFQTIHSDITTYNHRFFFDAFINSWNFIMFFILINNSLITWFHGWRWIFEHSWKIWKCRLHYQKSNSWIIKNQKILTIYQYVEVKRRL